MVVPAVPCSSVPANASWFAAVIVVAMVLAGPAFSQLRFATLLEGRAVPRFSPPSGSGARLAGDVDGDGDLDLLASSVTLQITLHLNDGNGNFRDVTATALPPAAGQQIWLLAMGDIDGDGDLDIVLFDVPVGIRIYCNDGTGVFADVTPGRIPPEGGVSHLLLGDVDGDGDEDIFVAKYSATIYSGFYLTLPETDRLYLNDGTGHFTTTRSVGFLTLPRDVEWGDVDGDGDIDLVYSEEWRTTLLVNDGAGRFTSTFGAGNIPVVGSSSVEMGDLDGDGDLDLLLADVRYFTSRTVYSYPYSYIRRTITSQSDSVFINDGSGRFTDETSQRMPATAAQTSSHGTVCDLDLDGDLDLLMAGRSNRFYENDGAGRFVDSSGSIPSGSTSSFVVGDFDADGDLDLISGFGDYYLNLRRHLDSPDPLQIKATYTLRAYFRGASPTATNVALPFVAPAVRRTPLPPLGMLWLQPDQLIALPPQIVSAQTGEALIPIRIPNVTGLVGTTLYSQVLFVSDQEPSRLSNLTGDALLP